MTQSVKNRERYNRKGFFHKVHCIKYLKTLA